jgi:surface protein
MKTLKESILSSTKTGKAAFLTPETKDELIDMIKNEILKNGLNCDLNHIKTHKITDMSYLFSANIMNGYGLNKFNGDISKWDVSSVKNMRGMFEDNKAFNQPLNDWDVSSVENMIEMFAYSNFNQPLDKWNVSSVEYMGEMFAYSKFNQPINDWDVSSVENMIMMFYRSKFNQNISKWNVSNVTDMCSMFAYSKFNQDISNWEINPKCKTNRMFNR